VYAIAKDVPVMKIFNGVWPYLIALLVCCLILLLFPQVALFLPSFVK